MKSSVPPTAKIAKDAKECVQECVSEFISFITAEVSGRVFVFVYYSTGSFIAIPSPTSFIYGSRAHSVLFAGRREMPARKAQDDRRGGYPVRHGELGVRELCGDAEDPFGEAEAGEFGFDSDLGLLRGEGLGGGGEVHQDGDETLDS